MKTLIQKDIDIIMFIEALFIIVKIWKQSECPSIDKWEKKMFYIYIYTHIHVVEYMQP